jgi:hypothetical protein
MHNSMVLIKNIKTKSNFQCPKLISNNTKKIDIIILCLRNSVLVNIMILILQAKFIIYKIFKIKIYSMFSYQIKFWNKICLFENIIKDREDDR